MSTVPRNWSATLSVQYLHCSTAAGFWSVPGAADSIGCRYCAQLMPFGGSKTRVSAAEHVTGRSCSRVDTIPEIQYVNGETRYMKLQKPGSASRDCSTPLKMVLIMV